METELIVIIIALVVTALGTAIGFSCENKTYGWFSLVLLVINCSSLSMYFRNKDSEIKEETTIETTSSVPTALDVYNGKTTLQVTTIMEGDSIVKTDTIVVFKK